MPRRVWGGILAAVVLATITLLLPDAPTASGSPALTLQERIDAQRLLEGVYHAHLQGQRRPFETAVPAELTAERVATSLRQSLALERIWRTPVTPAALRGEVARMTRDTRRPDRLRELFAVLGHDAHLIEECLARPGFVDREIRERFSRDPVIHAGARREAEALRGRFLRGEASPHEVGPRRRLIELRAAADGDEAPRRLRETAGRRGAVTTHPTFVLSREELARRCSRLPASAGEAGPLEETRGEFRFEVLLVGEPTRALVAIFAVPKITWKTWWSAIEARFDPADARTAAPAWADVGAEAAPSATTDAGAPSPASVGPAPQAICPADLWSPTGSDGVPGPREAHTAVWTGTHLIVWGGFSDHDLDTGAMYDPAVDAWTPLPADGAPSGRSYHSAVWTGSEMIVWGGYDGTELRTGGRYDPTGGTWSPTATDGAPAGRDGHTAVWTGSEMIVWGGIEDFLRPSATGGRYDPGNDSWRATNTQDAAPRRTGHTAVWSGSEMIVWGGTDGLFLDSGGRYDPAGDAWTTVPAAGAPAPRSGHTALWTGGEMIVWGGYNGTNLATGGIYDPGGGWREVPTDGAPSPRSLHTAVWTGQDMIVWGGHGGGASTDTGGRFDPAGTWRPTESAGAPAPRRDHRAVWTGATMIVWGGTDGLPLATGGEYAPGDMNDADGDGRICAADCNDLDPTAWGTPGEARDLMFLPDGRTLSWLAPSDAGGSAIAYDVLRSDDPADFATTALCLESDDTADLVADDGSVPAPDTAVYHVIRAQSACPAGEGSIGSASDGTPRIGRSCP